MNPAPPVTIIACRAVTSVGPYLPPPGAATRVWALIGLHPFATFRALDARAHVSGRDLDPVALLGGKRVRRLPALRHGGRGRHVPPRDVPARPRPGAVEGRVRPAVASPHRRPLRRKSQSPRRLLSVSGGAQARAARRP